MISIEIKEYKKGSLKDYDFDLDSVLADIEKKKEVELEAKKIKAVETGDIV
ncbi:hypothetical protein HOK00_08160 [bacterium]|nr:hypothetical protein [bacterium]